MKYQVNEVEINPDDNVTVTAVTRKIAVFERLVDAENYIDYLYEFYPEDEDRDYRIFDENNIQIGEF